jgi:heme/copper-type cytochrome/quinol oxidase subunit 1
MLGARDTSFPRLSAYAFWAYAVGGLVFFCSLFAGWARQGGWFMNPPLTTETYAPGFNADSCLPDCTSMTPACRRLSRR